MNGNGLFNSITLDVMIGLAFVYILLAVICTTINEWLAGLLKLRSKNLASAIRQLLDRQPGPGSEAGWLLKEFYGHPLISGMLKPGKTGDAACPSYLPSRTFATAVMDLVTAHKPGPIQFGDLETGIKALSDGDVKKALLALIQNARTLEEAQKNIETWYDDTMDRASGWFKRRTQLVTIFVAIFLTALTNADTINIVRTLWRNPTQRTLLVQKAEKRVANAKEEDSATPDVSVEYTNKDKPLEPTIVKDKKPSKDELDALGGVLGWPEACPAKDNQPKEKDTQPKDSQVKDTQPRDVQATSPNDSQTANAQTSDSQAEDCHPAKVDWPQRLLGWFLTIVAVSLGAPFWFDILNKFINIRDAGKKPKTSEQNSADPGSPNNAEKQGGPNARVA